MATDKLTVLFSQEELIVLTTLLRLSSFEGLGDNPLKGLTDGEKLVAMGAGERGLLARNFIRIEDGEVQLDRLISNVIKTCASATRTVGVERKVGGKLEWWFYHEGADLSVQHTMFAPGVHLFHAAHERFDIGELIGELIGLGEQGAPDGYPGQVSASKLSIATDLAAMGDVAKARNLLIADGLDVVSAANLINALQEAGEATAIVVIKADNDMQERLSILQTPSGCWLIERPTAGDVLSVQPIAATDLRTLLGEQLVVASASTAA